MQMNKFSRINTTILTNESYDMESKSTGIFVKSILFFLSDEENALKYTVWFITTKIVLKRPESCV